MSRNAPFAAGTVVFLSSRKENRVSRPFDARLIPHMRYFEEPALALSLPNAYSFFLTRLYLSWIEYLATNQRVVGSNPASRAIFRNRSHRKGLRFRLSGASFRSRKRSSGPYFGRPTRTFEAPFENSFSSFLAFPAADVLIFCFSADAERLSGSPG